MEDFLALVRLYQAGRTDKDYAAALGVSQPYLSKFYAGQVGRPWALLIGFLAAYPDACPVMCRILARMARRTVASE